MHRHMWSKPLRSYGRTIKNCRSSSGGMLLCFCILVKVGRGKSAKWVPR
jgi:hypothetical protein